MEEISLWLDDQMETVIYMTLWFDEQSKLNECMVHFFPDFIATILYALAIS